MIKEISKELSQLIFYLNSKEKDKVFKALKISEIAHSNQLRKSGDPFITHPIEVAKILTSIKLDGDSIVAGLLHDTLEDTKLGSDEIEKNFGKQISELVQGLTKISKYSLKANNQKFGENYKKLILATTKDLRVILIKLADRLHNMRTISHIRGDEKRKKISFETLEIYAPLAERLGMQEVRSELDDLSFSVIEPEIRDSILQRLKLLRQQDENVLQQTIKKIQDLLNEKKLTLRYLVVKKNPTQFGRK